jgi:hypothetical protein
MDALALMRLEADTGFTYDARGRMLTSNEPHAPVRQPAPRFYVGRTMAGHVLRFGSTLPDALAEDLSAIIADWETVDALSFPSALGDAILTALGRSAPVIAGGEYPAYRFPESLAVPAGVVRLTAANRDSTRETYPWLHRSYDGWGRCFVAMHDGAAVSVCFSSRVGRQAEAAGVSTLPDFRGRGYASGVTAAWGESVRAAGRIPLYGTSRDNVASQGVARRVGLIMYGVTATWA